MRTVLERLPQRARVAVIRLRSLGDCVLTTPALALLKQARPDLRIAVAVEPRFAAVFENNPHVEAVLDPEVSRVRRWRPDLCVNFHGGARSAILTALSGAAWRAGFGHYRFRWLYNARIPRAQEILGVERVVHTVEHLASAMFFLGVQPGEIPRARLEPTAGPRGSVVVIHPFASRPDKTWPASRFVEAAEKLDLDPVIVGGPDDDFAPFRRFRCEIGRPLREAIATIARAALFLGNDSGPAHIAAACGVPVVVLFGSSDPRVWGPWRTASEALSGPQGIGSIEVARVLEAIARLRVPA
ncbi:MAG: glycosyltransferase family 9 protein [Bryobacteraceae bacterium]